MTEYTREPIEVADMQWGDHITFHREGNEPFIFVGLLPPEASGYLVARDPDRRAAQDCLTFNVDDRWFKLTPKPDPVLCTHCGSEIDIRFGIWYHSIANQRTCTIRLKATPPESVTS